MVRDEKIIMEMDDKPTYKHCMTNFLC